MMNTSSEVGLAEISAILDRIPEPVIVIDPEDRIVMAKLGLQRLVWVGTERILALRSLPAARGPGVHQASSKHEGRIQNEDLHGRCGGQPFV